MNFTKENIDLFKQYHTDVVLVQKQLDNSKRKLNREIFESVPEIDDDSFWKFIDIFKEVLEDAKKRAEYGAFKRAGHELARLAVVGDRINNRGIFKVIQVLNKIEEIRDKLYNILFDTIKGCGDDTYGDILDSFVLHGRELTEKALRGELEEEGVTVEYDKYYLGENYLRMSIEEGIETFLPGTIRDLEEYGYEQEEEEEKPKSVEDKMKDLL